MCGIAGYFQFIEPIPPTGTIEAMTTALAHRGPDAQGIYRNGAIALGHRRLSIIDLNERANQPLFDAHRHYAIILNGEIYNYQEVKARLTDYPFQTESDTEVVLAAFLKWGWDCLHYLKGMFAFALWDQHKQQLNLARDRMGVKPLYYYKDENGFLFASEIRSLLASGLIKRKICRHALADYFQFQSFQSPQTIIEGIQELESGSFLEVRQGHFHQQVYWSMEKAALPEMTSRSTARTKVKALLLNSVKRRMVADVPVAAFLSGGIDSTAIVALMAELATAPQTFNISFREAAYDESSYAKLVSRKYGTRHHQILLKPETFLEDFPSALNAMDSPSGDGINTYIVSKAVKNAGIKVALSGLGGDELFAGYPIFQQWRRIHRNRMLWKLPLAWRNRVALLIRTGNIRTQRIADLLRLNAPEIESVYPLLRQLNSKETVNRLLNTSASGSTLFQSLLQLQPTIGRFPLLSQLSMAELKGYTRQTLLKDTDQMSMAQALEVREPFFDHELVEYVLGLPDTCKQGSPSKSLLVHALGTAIPPAIYNRPKKGFVLPGEQWFRNELTAFCADKMMQLSQRDFIHGNALKQYWNDFLAGRNAIRWTHILLLLALENYIQLHRLE